jgi:hypothetical protein
VKALKEQRIAAGVNRAQHSVKQPTTSAKLPTAPQQMRAPDSVSMPSPSKAPFHPPRTRGAAADTQKKQNFKPPDRNFNSFDIHAGRSKRPYRGTRNAGSGNVGSGSFGAGAGGREGSFGGSAARSSRLPPKDVSMTQEDVMKLADHISLSLSFDPLGASKSKGFDFRSQQEPLKDLDDIFDSFDS